MGNKIQKITSNLWFGTQAEEAAQFYISIFKHSKINRVIRYGNERHKMEEIEEGVVMTVEFEIRGSNLCRLKWGTTFQI
ncbi:VOC family protein [Cytobacillus sp. FJAT-53684]|uniref:VOC family protein n=1 Tax=Cytobacillus mangrovibacter TaxID=3299024 RepID=A0ABW6JZV5_9BACI